MDAGPGRSIQCFAQLSDQRPCAVMVLIIGALGFSVVSGMQARVLRTAGGAPTLAIAVNASAYQLAAAFAGWFGGRVIDTLGVRSVYLVAAALTILGVAVSAFAWYRDRTATAATDYAEVPVA